MWRRSGDIVAATNRAAGLGRALGYLLIGSGLLLTFGGAPGGLWLGVIGVFLVFAASAERLHEEIVFGFTGVRAEELTSHPATSIPAEFTLLQAHEYFVRYRYAAFPVIDPAGRVLGTLSIEHLNRTPRRARWTAVSAGELADRDPALIIRE
jgi:CBS domain-containing protein